MKPKISVTILLVWIGLSVYLFSEEKTVTMDFSDTPLVEALRDTIDQTDLCLVIPQGVFDEKVVTFRASDVPWRDAFSLLLHPEGYTWYQANHIIYIVSFLEYDSIFTEGTFVFEGDSISIDEKKAIEVFIDSGAGEKVSFQNGKIDYLIQKNMEKRFRGFLQRLDKLSTHNKTGGFTVEAAPHP